jgi:hypothetical protein
MRSDEMNQLPNLKGDDGTGMKSQENVAPAPYRLSLDFAL